ncbi:hypothetical protein D8B26_003141 [Coccidioides posadasii str. Silveira]|uniref:uncharacterized protein n=1 Tax=Coccidioides posadasii (strain RMSCC 757 / Silveira) TaxID=443226 RepID=UPI001BEE3C8A|nr:hypothetical protein D8B26_003141 [Coccidioides posadasii str. Silveira]
MATRVPPTIPPRPSRSPNTLSPPNADIPKIPPRPTKRRTDQSTSPKPDRFAPSPLNALPGEATASNDDRPSRPPSVAALPSIGQEGIEYEGAEYQSMQGGEDDDQIQQPVETRSVNRDLYLHAPRPSLPDTSAKAQVEVVTRTDSRQAAAAGFGKAVSPSDEEVKYLDSQREPSAEQRKSLHPGDEHGISEIGQRVPMIPNAGYVQAPSPAPLGANNEPLSSESSVSQRQGRQQARNRSGLEWLPPSSYGLHGHGVHMNDKFEKAWYDEHPEELTREEQTHYGPGNGSPRPEWAMSSEDLNKIVKLSAQKTIDSSAEIICTPEEEIGYIATEELASRFKLPSRGSPLGKNVAQGLEPAPESLRKNSTAQENDHDKEEVKIHIDEPIHHQHHPDGFMPASDNHKPHGGDSLEENGEESPILAEDEVDERAEHLQPAVSPTLVSHIINSPERKTHTRSPSVGSNRVPIKPLASPTLSSYNSRTGEGEDMRQPLEDVEEYEPLFPDDGKNKKPLPAEEQLKKEPEYHRHKFPSQDIWEDAPDSLQLQTTVSMAESPKDENKSPVEIAEEEMAKLRQGIQRKPSSASTGSSGPSDDVPARPGVKQSFPSKDIWEEAPESQQLEATVQIAEQQNEAIPAENTEKASPPGIPVRPSKRPQRISPERQSPPVQAESTLPPTDAKKPPAIPERPKPQIPPRPPRPLQRTSGDSSSKIKSSTSNDTASPPVVKPKPPIPSRPLGSKIAALKAGFLSDLDNRLKLGPQAPKPQEKNEEEKPQAPKGPLSDARKGRARGPARRKPAVSSPPEDTTKVEATRAPQVTLVEPWSLWSMRPDGALMLCQENKKPESICKTGPSPDRSKEALPPEQLKVEESVILRSPEPESQITENQKLVEEQKSPTSMDNPEPDLSVQEHLEFQSPLHPTSEQTSPETSTGPPFEPSSIDPASETDLTTVPPEKEETSRMIDTKKDMTQAQPQEKDIEPVADLTPEVILKDPTK